MLGSTIIAEKDPSRLARITSVEDLDDLSHVDLDAMTTIDFESLATAGNVAWAEGDPIQFDEDGGIALFKVSEAGLSYLLSHAASVPEEYQQDVRTLAEFVAKNGTAHIYELATF
jgi:hypothetical protein